METRNIWFSWVHQLPLWHKECIYSFKIKIENLVLGQDQSSMALPAEEV
jgi:hypothetical protein